MQIVYALIILGVLIGMYQSIYLLNLSLKKRSDDKREIQRDVQKFGSCCGKVDSCTLEAKLEEMRAAVRSSLPESIVEVSSAGKTEEVE